MTNSNDPFGNKKPMQITQKEFGAKFRSKRECYKFLTVDAKAYIDKYEHVTTYYLKDLISGSKKCEYIPPN